MISIYLSLVPLVIFSILLFFGGWMLWDARKTGKKDLRVLGWLLSFPFPFSLAGMLVALVRAF